MCEKRALYYLAEIMALLAALATVTMRSSTRYELQSSPSILAGSPIVTMQTRVGTGLPLSYVPSPVLGR
jgi:hypothetical protein